jgi:hypothetical protein
MIKIARPIAISAAATVKINITKTCPTGELLKEENATKFKFTANSMISIVIRILIIDFLLYKTPKIPTEKSKLDKIKKCERGMSNDSIPFGKKILLI